MRPYRTSSADSLAAAWIGESEKIQSDLDDVLLLFLQEIVQLDQIPPSETVASDQMPSVATLPAKKRRKTWTQPVDEPQPDNVPMTRWYRQKQELETLKEQVRTLRTHAAFLKSQRVPVVSSNLEKLVQIETSEWQEVVKNETRRLQSAKQENAELKQRLQTCVQISGALQTRLCEANSLRRAQLSHPSIASRELHVQRMLEEQAENARVLDLLEQSVNARVDEIRAVVREVAQPALHDNAEQVSITRSDESHAAMEFKVVRVLPFGLDLVSTVCWRVARLGWKTQGFHAIKRSEDVVSTDWYVPVELEKGETVDIRVRSIAKRFVVPEGFVILAESWTEWPARLAASGAWTRVTRESGWGLLHSYSSNGSDVSRLVMHLTSEPAGLDTNTSCKLLSSPAVSDIVIPSYRILIHNRQQCVDNRLMDAVLAQGRPQVSAI